MSSAIWTHHNFAPSHEKCIACREPFSDEGESVGKVWPTERNEGTFWYHVDCVPDHAVVGRLTDTEDEETNAISNVDAAFKIVCTGCDTEFWEFDLWINHDCPADDQPGEDGVGGCLSPEDVEHIEEWAENATTDQVAAAMREKLRLEHRLTDRPEDPDGREEELE